MTRYKCYYDPNGLIILLSDIELLSIDIILTVALPITTALARVVVHR